MPKVPRLSAKVLIAADRQPALKALRDDGGVNRLGASTSPYLLQHKDNPVDWWEWGPDAFAEAKQRNVPVLLSVGYAACHWCHEVDRSAAVDGNLRNRRSAA